MKATLLPPVRRRSRASRGVAAVLGATMMSSGLFGLAAPAHADTEPAAGTTAWHAVPVLRERTDGQPAVPALAVIDLAAYDLTTTDLTARGIPVAPYATAATWSEDRLRALAVPEEDLDDVVPPVPSDPTGGGASAASVPAGATMPISVYQDQSLFDGSQNNKADADTGWQHAVDLFRDRYGMPINRLRLITGSNVKIGGTSKYDIATACDMQRLSLEEMKFASYAGLVVIYSNFTVSDNRGQSGYGLTVDDGDVSWPLSHGESEDECATSPTTATRITPAVIPSVYISPDYALVPPPIEEYGRTEFSYYTAHEIGHAFGMAHSMAKCVSNPGVTGGKLKTLEAYTSGDGTPSACGNNTDLDSRYVYYFNDDNPGGSGPIIKAEWDRFANCAVAGWCSSNATPSAPSGVVAAPDSGMATVTWNTPAFNGGSAITGYCVYVGTSPTFMTDTPVNSGCTVTGNSLPVPGLTNGVRYYFYVRAKNATGIGPRSGYATTVVQQAWLSSTTIYSKPATLKKNTTYTICWSVAGAGQIWSTRLHYGTTSALGSMTPERTGIAPSGFCDSVTAPASGKLYLESRATGPNNSVVQSPQTVIDVVELTGTAVTQYPASVGPYEKFTVRWSVTGNGPVDHTDLHYGTSSTNLSSRSTVMTSPAPTDFMVTLTAPLAGTTYIKSHATGPSNEVESTVVQVPVLTGNDCGTGTDAGGAHATATSVTPPKTNCPATLATTTDTEDWYQFSATAGQVITAGMTPNGTSNFDLCIYRPDGTLAVSCGGSGTGLTESKTYTANVSGQWRVRVLLTSGSGSYTMSLSLAAPQNDCGTGNDAAASHGTATSISLPKSNCSGTLVTSTDTADWYQFSVTAGQRISASMTPNASADFDICIYNPSGSLVAGCTAGSNGTTDTLLYDAPTTGSYRLVVQIWSGTGSYTMSVSAASAQNDCSSGGDAGGSHGAATSISLPKSNCSGTLVTSTDTADWYQFSVTAGQQISASMTPNASADFDICIYNPSGSLVAGCTTGSNGTTDTLAHTATVTGSYRLVVQIWSGTGSYTMSVSAASAQNDCNSGGDAGGSHGTATSISLPKSNCPGSIATSSDQDWYQFYVTNGQQINGSLTPNASADFDICIYDPNGYLQGACTAGGPGSTDTISRIASMSGYYRAVVQIWSGTGSYTMSMSVGTPPSGDQPFRDDDGEADSYMRADYVDDTAIKRITVTSAQMSGRTTATLHIFAKAVKCTASGNAWYLKAGNNNVANFDPCATWSQQYNEWKTFSFPISGNVFATENSFTLERHTGDWTTRGMDLAIDIDNDNGHSTMIENDSNYPGGELMWYLTLS